LMMTSPRSVGLAADERAMPRVPALMTVVNVPLFAPLLVKLKRPAPFLVRAPAAPLMMPANVSPLGLNSVRLPLPRLMVTPEEEEALTLPTVALKLFRLRTAPEPSSVMVQVLGITPELPH